MILKAKEQVSGMTEKAIKEFSEAVKNLRMPWPFVPLPVNPAGIRFVIGDGTVWPGMGKKCRCIVPDHCFYYASKSDGTTVKVGYERWEKTVAGLRVNREETVKATGFVRWVQRYLAEASSHVLESPRQKAAMDEVRGRARGLELCGKLTPPTEPSDMCFTILLWYVQYTAQVLVMNFVRNGDRVRLWPGAEVVFRECHGPELRLYYPKCYPPTTWTSVSLDASPQAITDALAAHYNLWTPIGVVKAIRACEEVVMGICNMYG